MSARRIAVYGIRCLTSTVGKRTTYRALRSSNPPQQLPNARVSVSNNGGTSPQHHNPDVGVGVDRKLETLEDLHTLRPHPRRRPMWPPRVVVHCVHAKHPAQVPLTEDQHPIGDLGPHCQDEAFGEAVRARAAGRDLEHLDARIGEYRVERGCELSSTIADQGSEPSASPVRRGP